MGTRSYAVAACVTLALGLAGCTDEPAPVPAPSAAPTSDADCAARIPDQVLTTLGWTPVGAATASVRGCRREAEQGYVEVRDEPGYDELCRTLDRSGSVAPGQAVGWVPGAEACAVEPDGDLGQTKVAVRRDVDRATLVSVVALTATPQAQVRAAVAELVG